MMVSGPASALATEHATIAEITRDVFIRLCRAFQTVPRRDANVNPRAIGRLIRSEGRIAPDPKEARRPKSELAERHILRTSGFASLWAFYPSAFGLGSAF